MTNFFQILLFSFFSPLCVLGQSKVITTKTYPTKLLEDTSYVIDSAYLTDGDFPFALDDLKLSNNLPLQKKQKDELIKNHIKSIQVKGQYTEKFDKKGNKIFFQYLDAWTQGSTFRYEFGRDGLPISICILDTNGNVVGKAKYKYDEQGKLLQAGELLFKYYPNGLLRSVENGFESETYHYDSLYRLIHINFDLHPDIVACGNRDTEWLGQYNLSGQLVTEQTIGFPDNLIEYHQYSSNGRLIQTKIEGGFEKLTIKYFYTNGLLTSTKTYSQRGTMIHTEKYIYERY